MSTGGKRADRIDRLATELRTAGVDALVLNSPVNMGYLHGYTEGGGERFLTMSVRADASVRMICPALSENQARRCGLEDGVSVIGLGRNARPLRGSSLCLEMPGGTRRWRGRLKSTHGE